jgi:hypothetical protein
MQLRPVGHIGPLLFTGLDEQWQMDCLTITASRLMATLLVIYACANFLTNQQISIRAMLADVLGLHHHAYLCH